ncbi:MAG: response regulator [Candidatus Binatia bacterium]
MDLDKGQPHLLIVEDDDIDFETFVRLARKSAAAHPVQIQRCANGEEALDCLYGRGPYHQEPTREHPRLIFLDLNLPKCDGRAVLQAREQDPNLRTIPVIVLSASDNTDDVKFCYQHGANSYLTKQFNLEQFANALNTTFSYWLTSVILPPPA